MTEPPDQAKVRRLSILVICVAQGLRKGCLSEEAYDGLLEAGLMGSK